MATVTGKVYGGRKSVNDYKRQADRLSQYATYATQKGNAQRAYDVDRAAHEAYERGEDLRYSKGVLREIDRADNWMEKQITTKGGREADYEAEWDKRTNKALNRKYSTTKGAMYSRMRRERGLNGG